MNFDTPTDKDIEALIQLRKTIINPNAQWIDNRGSKQKNHEVQADNYHFSLYLRQNTFDIEHFSCGLTFLKPNGQKMTLLRYNGSNHRHGEINYACHIHKATAQAILEGKRPENFAYQTDTYKTLEEALVRLCQDANIGGLENLQSSQLSLLE